MYISGYRKLLYKRCRVSMAKHRQESTRVRAKGIDPTWSQVILLLQDLSPNHTDQGRILRWGYIWTEFWKNWALSIDEKRGQNAVLGCNLKNNRMISVHFQGKPFNITVIQVYAPNSNAKEAEWFYEDLQNLLELTPKKRCPFHH